MNTVWFIRLLMMMMISMVSISYAIATPPPETCTAVPMEGFTAAYPSFPIGDFTWCLVVFGFGLLMYSHRYYIKRDAINHKGIYFLSALGVIFIIVCVAFILLLLISGQFRNDCYLCRIDRPLVTLFDEVVLLVQVILSTSFLFFLLHYTVQKPIYRHIGTVMLIPLTALGWFIFILVENKTYLSTYCLP